MSAFLGLTSLLGLVVSLILIIIGAIKKKSVKTPTIVLVSSIALFIIALSIPSETNTATATAPTTTEAISEEAIATEPVKEEPVVTEKVKAVEPIALPKVTSVKLLKEYDDNEVRADKSYKDKDFEITGKVESISIVLGNTIVSLSDGTDFSLTNVDCVFEEENIDKVADIDKGSTVTVIGHITGLSWNVTVEDCKIK